LRVKISKLQSNKEKLIIFGKGRQYEGLALAMFVEVLQGYGDWINLTRLKLD